MMHRARMTALSRDKCNEFLLRLSLYYQQMRAGLPQSTNRSTVEEIYAGVSRCMVQNKSVFLIEFNSSG